MADDKTSSSDAKQTPGATEAPKHAEQPKVYEVFEAPESANALPEGYGQNTAGGRPPRLSLEEAVRTVRWEDFAKVHTYPCVRESALTGIGAAFGVGGLRMLFGGMW